MFVVTEGQGTSLLWFTFINLVNKFDICQSVQLNEEVLATNFALLSR